MRRRRARPRRLRWPMTAAWLAMGAIVTAGLYAEQLDDQERCEAGNTFRRQDLPAAFDAYSDFLGHELGATPAQIEDAKARFAVVLDELLPERDCPIAPW